MMYLLLFLVAVERLEAVVNRCHLRFRFAAWCNFIKDSRRIKEVLKVPIFSLWEKKLKSMRIPSMLAHFCLAEAQH